MTRPYGVKGRKRKYDREEEDEDQQPQPKTPVLAPNELTLTGIPIAPSHCHNGVIFILERASLEVAKVGKTYQLLNSDDHANFLRKINKNPDDCRPDITHQALLSILDSPLNKAGRLRAVYIKTEKGLLIEVKHYVRIPRVFKRFAGLMLQLFQKLSTSTAEGNKLLSIIKNPVTQYLPVNSRKISLSYSSEKLVNMNDYVSTVPNNVDLVFTVGAMRTHGKIETEYTDDSIAVSGYPLSAAYCISRICGALEAKWKIV